MSRSNTFKKRHSQWSHSDADDNNENTQQSVELHMKKEVGQPKSGTPHRLSNLLPSPVLADENPRDSSLHTELQIGRIRFKKHEEFEVFPIQDPSVSRDLSPLPLDRVPERSCLKRTGRLRFRERFEFEVFPIKDPSVSREIPPPPLNRIPQRSCLKQKPSFPPIIEELLASDAFHSSEVINQAINNRHIDNSLATGDDSVASELSYTISTVDLNIDDPDALQKRDSTNLTNNITDFSSANVNAPQKSCNDTVYSEEYEWDKDELSDCSAEFNKDCDKLKKKKSQLFAPGSVDFWMNTRYNRLNRETQYIREILDVNTRATGNREFIKRSMSTLLLLEVCREFGKAFTKCYVFSADFPVKMVIIPLCAFPPDKIPPLGSMWTSPIECLNLMFRNRRMVILRVPFKKMVQRCGTIKDTIPHRIIQFGDHNTPFYCEMLQIYIRLRHINTNCEELLLGCYGGVTYSRYVLQPLDPGITFLEGHGWIEPKPGALSVIREARESDPWLLIEPFVADYSTAKTDVDAELKKAYQQSLLRQEIENKKNKERIDRMLKKREEGYTMHPRTVVTEKAKRNAAIVAKGQYDKRGRRENCEHLIKKIFERGTKAPLFRQEKKQELLDLIKNREHRGARMGKLCLVLLPLLEDEKTFNYLKESESQNLDDFRQIIKWTIDYAKGQRELLSSRVYNFIFPLSDDGVANDEWAD